MATVALGSEERGLLRTLVAIASFCALVLAIACLATARAVLLPVALAILLTFLLGPVADFFQHRGLNRVASVLLVVLLTASLIGGIAYILSAQVSRLAYDLHHNQQYQQNIQRKLEDLRGFSKGGVINDVQATVNEISEKLTEGTEPKETLVVTTTDTSVVATVRTTVEPLLGPIATAALVTVLVIFMLLQREDLRNRMIGLAGTGQITVVTSALADASQRISKYLLMQLIVNTSYGLAVGIGLFLCGVPYAFLWGFMAAVLRYIPYVGPWVAAILPITISLVAFTGWTKPLIVMGLFVILELLSNIVMEPLLYGQSVGISQVALLVATGFWTWLWGPVGLVLATPLTVCIIVLGRHVPHLRFLSLLLSDQPALAPHTAYYQRLIAQDEEEANDLVEKYVTESGAESVYDDVFIPAILLARQDRKNGTLDHGMESFIHQATREILERTVTEQFAVMNQGDSPDPPPAAPQAVLVFGISSHTEAEELIVQMLHDLMLPMNYWIEVISTKIHVAEICARIKKDRPQVVFLAVLPGGLPQARYQCRAIRRAFADLPIVVGYWGKKEDYDKVLARLRQAGASYLVTSLVQARSRLVALTQPTTEITAAKAADPTPEQAHAATPAANEWLSPGREPSSNSNQPTHGGAVISPAPSVGSY